MQHLSLAALGPEAQRLFDDLSRKLAHDYTGEIITFAGITFVLLIAAAWVAATALVKEDVGFGKAARTGLHWFMGFFIALTLSGAAFYFARLRGQGMMATASLAIGAILLLYTAVHTPVKIYKISFVKGLAFAAIGVLVHLAAQVAVQKAMNDPLMLSTRLDQARRLAALPPEEAAEVLTRARKITPPALAAVTPPTPVAPKVSPAPTPTPTPTPTPPPKPREKTIAERHDELKKAYADLMTQRETLRESDDDALAAYTRNTAAYVEKLAQLQKDADAEKK